MIVLEGTFALGISFAGNDLVNFIGVPLAGLQSYQDILANPDARPDTFIISSLTGIPEKADTIHLLIAGVITILTLYFSKKNRSVIEKTLNLSLQRHGDERFGASNFSRAIMRSSLNMTKSINTIIPQSVI